MLKTNLNLYNKSFRYVFLVQLHIDIKMQSKQIKKKKKKSVKILCNRPDDEWELNILIDYRGMRGDGADDAQGTESAPLLTDGSVLTNE